jgi:hypothetical protein
MNIIKSLVVVFSLLLLGCGNKLEEEELIGKWTVSEFEAKTPQFSQALINGARNEVLSTTYSFYGDKTFSIKSKLVSNGKNGKFEYLADSNLLILTYSDLENSPVKFKIEALSEKSLKWTQDLGEIGSLKYFLKKE